MSGGTGATFTLSLNTSDIRSLDHVLMRASQNDAATMKLGQRYPIVNATFAPIYNTSAIASVIGNQRLLPSLPSSSGPGAEPQGDTCHHADRDVSLKLEMQVRSLGSQNVNGIPIINNREYSGYITLKNGESGVVAGLVTKDDIRSMAGLPFLAKVPALTYAAAQSTKNVTEASSWSSLRRTSCACRRTGPSPSKCPPGTKQKKAARGRLVRKLIPDYLAGWLA